MTVSKNYMTMYRTPESIYLQIQDVVDSFLSFIHLKLNPNLVQMVDKLRTLDLHITSQIMHVFEAPLDKHDFKDLVKQLIDVVMDDLIERANSTGIITKDESTQLQKALDESKTIEFCSIYNPVYLM